MELLFAGKTIQNVVNSYSDILIRIAFQNTKSLTDAEDIVQEVYIKLFKYKGDFKTEEHLKAWLIKTTYHRCKDFFRSSWFRKVVPIHEDMEFFAPEEQKVMEEIFQLKLDDRTVIYLYYYEGYSIKEIAYMLGKNENTISSKLQRARKKLKHIIEEGVNDDE
ncbi:RNA polymerase sigma factor [Paramaledivibacter caminithermalis]|uniref:RNA polymerase sigma-70 factor, ECF subfamily n=1 Tax=Paramaledivibacter caminithermalis (strain DSM 15212 / CIP 107654 / DViRD3) TaxID=1121301 RepID=A0A1M6NAG5_PARC5|nr:sigma-70 family RNA polymerase sigma factor [Paramaledivibacter caminithermalis]SHJ92644.1 RNA polymerase sigma-70 factor, ECF subfamily [Paramaledivibacter caminithermalis DSM 15212]